MYKKDKSRMYKGLPEGFSGGRQHRAVLQQDGYAVDIRCIAVRSELIPVFEQVTGLKYVDTFHLVSDKKDRKEADTSSDKMWENFSEEEIASMSVAFGEEVHRRCLRVMWDPKVVKHLDI